ncbi:sedoheptulokinase-like [Tropilaelaps mercedesae]|uniref:Sedoheptulokinase-like n=1 Tax=Tropilaelaps mercedesae TaxID=418985 RepID=A0A1V9XEJ1_9ACAR|nr:sedoheptulokinase-like [Tropilaelaps mercedesae]
MAENFYILGLDLGTTTVKVCLINAHTQDKVLERSQPTKARIDTVSHRDEQCPKKILLALQNCLSTMERHYLNNVIRIGVCGQMHGVVLWKQNAWTYELANERFALIKENVSTLITWQDRRCSIQFLKTLPKTSSTKFVKPSSGFGCATMFWLLRNGQMPQDVEFAGTIQDLVVTMLTERPAACMTSQNAASFGYFDPERSQWDLQALEEANFPSRILPEVVVEDKEAGTLRHSWFGIPAGTVVYPATGDTQCAVLSGLRNREKLALLHIGTSAQVSFVVDQREQRVKGHYTFFPYFNGKYLCVAASVNGGNVLAHFVSMLRSWTRDLGVSLSESEIWDCLLAPIAPASEPVRSTGGNLRVKPIIFGERHDSHSTGSITGIGPELPTLSDTFRSICLGLIENLVEMLPFEILKKHDITTVMCAGKVICQNRILCSQVERVFTGFSVEFGSQCDSAFGAALAAALPSGQ